MGMLVSPYRHAVAGGGLPSTYGSARGIWDASDLDATFNDGDAVTAWAASVGAYTATGGAAKPVFKTSIVNGRDVVRSDGGVNGMPITASLLSSLTAGTMIYVGKVAGVGSVTGGALFGDFGTDGNQNHYPFTDSNVYEDFLCGGRTTWGNFTTVLQTWHVGVLRSQASVRNWRLAGVQRYNNSGGSFTTNGSPQLFRSGAGSGWGGDLAYWVFFPVYLSDLECAEWETYLTTLFAL